MSAAELRRLAEVAGLELQYSKLEGWYWHEENYNHTPWRPHESIEQAMIVAEAFRKQGYVIDIVLWPDGDAVVAIRNKFEHYSETEENTSLAICRAALAAAKED